MRRYFYFIAFLILSRLTGYSQFLANPSFEGPTGMSATPPSWSICDAFSTPDTQPGVNNVNNTASDGNTFISLVCRGDPAGSVGHSEDCETELLKPLLKGKCYKLQVDVCVSKNYTVNVFGDDYFYTNPMILKVYLDTALCSKTELILQSDVISNEDWKTLEVIFIPKRDYKFLYLQSDYTQQPYYFGNVLVDNVRIMEGAVPDLMKLDTIVDYGTDIRLNASPGIDYSWSPTEGLSCASCPDPVVTFTDPVTYTVEVINQDFCYNHKEYFKVKIKTFIPNVITPDGDGFNDAFRILGLEPNSSLVITNRLGEVLYKTDNYDNTWNGYYKGTLLPPDTYWYIYQPPAAKEKIVGFIYLKQTK